jgi:peptidoglycan-N-acetylglucosamine deacetylase
MTDARQIALTFDDGPGDATTPILDSLERHGAAATFFVLGRHVAGREAVLERMAGLGCEIGNHTFDHPRLSTVPAARVEEELTRASGAIASATGVAPPLMRPPYGDWSPETLEVATRLGLTIVLWSVHTRDWDARPAAEIVDAILAEARPGAVVVLHDASEADVDRMETARAVELVVPQLQEQGYSLVTVSELLRTSPGVRREVVPRRRGPLRRAARFVRDLF